MSKANLAEKLALFDEPRSPNVAGGLNGRHVKLAKLLGGFVVMPRGVEQRPVAEEEGHVLLFEPASTLDTGNVRDGLMTEALERI